VTLNRLPSVLAIETSAEQCSVALAHAGSLVQHRETVGYRIAERALSMIASLLAQQHTALRQIDAFAFASGPGAFTGLRVACALAQGLAFGNDRPVIPVGSLRALALAAASHLQRSARVMAAIDARMGQVYWAVYEGDERAHVLARPSLAEPQELAGLVAQWQPEVIAGDALRVFEAVWPAGCGIRLPQLQGDAAMVARLASSDLAEGRALNARDAAPEYVRDRVALTVAQRSGGPGSTTP
jgi:tRNA threonylcarbamoyladenosine biosynthesis protein TsaB